MYKVGDYVVYKRDVCKIVEIKKIESLNKDYYVMKQIDDDSLKIEIPVDNKMGYLRNLITKEEAEKLIENIPNIKPLNTNDKLIENEYKILMKSNKLEDLIKIIKTTYLRNNSRKESGKKIGEKDDTYFKNGERLLYNELSVSLNMEFEEVKNYIIKKINNLSKKD